MNTSFKAAGLILFTGITGCGSDNDPETTNLDLDRSAEAQLTVTVEKETFNSIEPIKRYTFLYNINGHNLSEVYDANDDGINDETNNYYYDSQGKIELIERDDDGDSILDSKVTYITEDMIQTVSHYYDYDADGIFDRIIVSTYGEFGYPQFSQRIDDNGDGSFNNITIHEYNDNNFRIKTSHDYDGDGIFDEITEYTPSPNNNENTPPNSVEDYNTIDQIYTYSYNSNYDPISRSYDRNGDGIIDEQTNYTYNEQGLLTIETVDDNADGIPETTHIYEYNDNGSVILKRTSDKFSDVTNIFNDNGDKTKITYDTNKDGNADYQINYTYSGDLTILENIYIGRYFYWH